MTDFQAKMIIEKRRSNNSTFFPKPH